MNLILAQIIVFSGLCLLLLALIKRQCKNNGVYEQYFAPWVGFWIVAMTLAFLCALTSDIRQLVGLLQCQ
jgi:hypothetical protein